MRAQEVASAIFKKLDPFLPQARLPGNRTIFNEKVKESLLEVCMKATSLAFIFQTSDVEYDWLQDSRADIDPSQVEIVASAGDGAFVPEVGTYKIVFGGVVKGGGVHGKLSDEVVHLRPTSVLLGPFKHDSREH
jgi:hypothetical protein